MYHVYLGLGSNVGDRTAALMNALRVIGERFTITDASSIYETEPVEMAVADWFLNMVVKIETSLAPVQLFYELHMIETELGKKPSSHLKPRVIDIDILLYEELSYADSFVQVPHRKMHRRRFVLMPMREIAPELRHPDLKRTIAELYDECADPAEVHRTTIPVPGIYHHSNRH